MKIELITNEQFKQITDIQENYPVLTFENKGYQYIDKSKMTEGDEEAVKQIESILKDNIIGFCSFTNFRTTEDSKVQIRLEYNYGAEDNSMSFTGVGYILLEELLNGFNEK